MLPTLVTLSGGKVPSKPVIDGRDISPLLFGKTKTSPREAHYYFAGYNLQAVRQGPWKLAIAAQPEAGRKATIRDPARPRLYNLDTEIGELTNVAEQHPEVVAKLQALASKMQAAIGGDHPEVRRPAGEAANPQPLYPMEATESAGPAARQPVELDTLKPGDSLTTAAAPQVGGRPFTISCTVETKQSDTVILAHGGVAAGYALYLTGSRVGFAVRTGADEAITRITTAEAVASPARITATLAADGTMRLSVDSAPPVTGKAPGVIPRQPAENFCLGGDDARPVTAYTGKEPFEGSIAGITITSP